MGEEVCAWITYKQDHNKTDIRDIVAFCQGKIAHFKIPRYFMITDQYPLTVTGKVKKNEMRTITNELLKQKSFKVIDLKHLKVAKL